MLNTTSFIGRQKEYTDIQQLLAQPGCRLLTLVGPGGIGKTRLALQLSALIGDQFARGLLWSICSPYARLSFFASAVANALGVSFTSQEPPLAQLARYLSDKDALIIMDNFEHLLVAAEQLATLLSAIPHVKYLITSQEALNLQEEWLYPVSGLTFSTGATTEQKYDAVRLFNERAQRVYPDFAPDKEIAAVIQICRLVEEMPLALELAAAWRKTLNCQDIAAEIQGAPGVSDDAFAECVGTPSQYANGV